MINNNVSWLIVYCVFMMMMIVKEEQLLLSEKMKQETTNNPVINKKIKRYPYAPLLRITRVAMVVVSV